MLDESMVSSDMSDLLWRRNPMLRKARQVNPQNW